MDSVTIDEVDNNMYFQSKHYDISWGWDKVSRWVVLRRCVNVNYGHSSSLSGIDIGFLIAKTCTIKRYITQG